jgi:hypothetical protein
LGFDAKTGSIWISTGFSQNDIRQYDLEGSLIGQFSPGFSLIDGLDFVNEELLLDIEPELLSAGQTVSFSSWSQPSGYPVGLFVIEIDATPVQRLVSLDVFFPADTWDLALAVPPGVNGHTLTFRCFACTDPAAHLGSVGSNQAISTEILHFPVRVLATQTGREGPRPSR